MFISWFSSKKVVEAASFICVDFIGIVKTNTKGFCKAKIEGFTKFFTDGSHIVLRIKPMVPG